MRFILGLLGGLLAGRFSGWVVWRRRQEELDAELAALRSDRAAAWQVVREVEAERDQLRAELESARQQPSALSEPSATRAYAALQSPPADDLRAIRGIGQVFAQRLNDAGILTFAELAARPPDELRAIVAAQPWQDVDTQAWIDEAHQRAQSA